MRATKGSGGTAALERRLDKFTSDTRAMMDAMLAVGDGWSGAYGLGVIGLAVETILRQVPDKARKDWLDHLQSAFDDTVH